MIDTLNSSYDVYKFLKLDNFIDKNPDINFGNKELIYIYKITDLTNNKIYIGKSKDIYRRAKEYIIQSKGEHGKRRPIWYALVEKGIENFIMEPIDYCYGKEISSVKEIYYIQSLDTMNPEKGYNVSLQSVNTPDKINRQTSRPIYAKERMKKSKICGGINFDSKEIICSIGLATIGKLINRSKDEVKSAMKRSSMLENAYIFYLDNETFQKQIEFADNRITIFKNKGYEDNDNCIHRYILFKEAARKIYKFLIKDKIEKEYTVKFIHQSDETETGYDFYDYKIFIEMYHTLIDDNRINPIFINEIS